MVGTRFITEARSEPASPPLLPSTDTATQFIPGPFEPSLTGRSCVFSAPIALFVPKQEVEVG